MDLRTNCSACALISSAGIWSVPGDFCLFSFSITISNSKALGSVTSDSNVCIPGCLKSLTPCTFSSSEKWFLHLVKILWDSVTKSPFSTFTFCYTSVWFFFYLINFKLINFGFQIFLLSPEMSASFTSYIFCIINIAFIGIL